MWALRRPAVLVGTEGAAAATSADEVSVAHGAIIVIAGVWAGMINTIVGSGTLVTFPVLLALGYAPLTANVSNGLGLVPGSLTGAIGYRCELAGLGGRVARLAVASVESPRLPPRVAPMDVKRRIWCGSRLLSRGCGLPPGLIVFRRLSVSTSFVLAALRALHVDASYAAEVLAGIEEGRGLSRAV